MAAAEADAVEEEDSVMTIAVAADSAEASAVEEEASAIEAVVVASEIATVDSEAAAAAAALEVVSAAADFGMIAPVQGVLTIDQDRRATVSEEEETETPADQDLANREVTDDLAVAEAVGAASEDHTASTECEKLPDANRPLSRQAPQMRALLHVVSSSLAANHRHAFVFVKLFFFLSWEGIDLIDAN